MGLLTLHNDQHEPLITPLSCSDLSVTPLLFTPVSFPSLSSVEEKFVPTVIRNLHIPYGKHAGITLSSRPNTAGVTVSDLVERDCAYKCGLRTGDVITSINGVDIVDPRTGTMMIDSITSQGSSAVIVIIPAAEDNDGCYEPPPLLKKHSSRSLRLSRVK